MKDGHCLTIVMEGNVTWSTHSLFHRVASLQSYAASQEGHTSTVEVLLEANADVNLQDKVSTYTRLRVHELYMMMHLTNCVCPPFLTVFLYYHCTPYKIVCTCANRNIHRALWCGILLVSTYCVSSPFISPHA